MTTRRARAAAAILRNMTRRRKALERLKKQAESIDTEIGSHMDAIGVLLNKAAEIGLNMSTGELSTFYVGQRVTVLANGQVPVGIQRITKIEDGIGYLSGGYSFDIETRRSRTGWKHNGTHIIRPMGQIDKIKYKYLKEY